jgi:hypothetical protein
MFIRYRTAENRDQVKYGAFSKRGADQFAWLGEHKLFSRADSYNTLIFPFRNESLTTVSSETILPILLYGVPETKYALPVVHQSDESDRAIGAFLSGIKIKEPSGEIYSARADSVISLRDNVGTTMLSRIIGDLGWREYVRVYFDRDTRSLVYINENRLYYCGAFSYIEYYQELTTEISRFLFLFYIRSDIFDSTPFMSNDQRWSLALNQAMLFLDSHEIEPSRLDVISAWFYCYQEMQPGDALLRNGIERALIALGIEDDACSARDVMEKIDGFAKRSEGQVS